MDYRAIITLALRLSGVLILVATVPYAPQTFFALISSGVTSFRTGLFLTAMSQLIPILVGLALIYFPGRIGEVLIRTPDPQEQSALTERLGEVAFVAVGVYFLATGLLELTFLAAKYWLYTVVVAEHDWDSAPSIRQEDFAKLISASMKLLLGFVMSFTARGLYRFVRSMRETKSKA